MKTTERVTKIAEIGEGFERKTKFNIVQNAHMFEILSGKVYTNQIGAIVRELCCNAYDAHVEVGQPDKPIEVHLPTNQVAIFSVRDYGPGLSVEQMETLYTTYGLSTKNGSNDYIGQLGIGSKAPFGYTDSFTIESHYEGMRYLYIARKGEDGLPELVSLQKPFPTEETGLKVSVPVNYGDIHRFTDECKTQLCFFNPMPTFFPHLDVKRVEPKVSTDTYEIGHYSGVLMGNVRYNVNSQMMREKTGDFAVRPGGNNILIKVGIGDVDIAPSRESVSWTPHTIRTLKPLVKQINASLVADIQKHLDTLSNVAVAYNYLQDLRLPDYRIRDFTYKGKEFPDFNINVGRFYLSYSGRATYERFSHSRSANHIAVNSNPIVYVPPEVNRPHARLKSFFHELKNGPNGNDVRCLWISWDLSEVEHFKELIGDIFPLRYYDDLKPPAKSKSGPRRKLAKTYVLYGKKWERYSVSGPCVYVKIHHNNVVNPIVDNSIYYTMDDLFTAIRKVFGKNVYGVRSAYYKEVEQDPNFTLLDDFLRQEVAKPGGLAALQSALVDDGDEASNYRLIWAHPKLSRKSLFYKLYSPISDKPEFSLNTCHKHAIQDILTALGQTSPNIYQETIDKLNTTYPLLRNFSLSDGDEIIDEVLFYINSKE